MNRMFRRRNAHGAGRGRADARDRGTVTAETAVGLPGLVLVLAMSLWGVAAAAAKIACVDAARAGARAAARGESPSSIRTAVALAAPAGSRVAVRRDDELASVEVVSTVRVPFGRGLPVLVVHASATAEPEPGGVPAARTGPEGRPPGARTEAEVTFDSTGGGRAAGE